MNASNGGEWDRLPLRLTEAVTIFSSAKLRDLKLAVEGPPHFLAIFTEEDGVSTAIRIDDEARLAELIDHAQPDHVQIAAMPHELPALRRLVRR